MESNTINLSRDEFLVLESNLRDRRRYWVRRSDRPGADKELWMIDSILKKVEAAKRSFRRADFEQLEADLQEFGC